MKRMLGFAALVLALPALADGRSWNLDEIYPSEKAWSEAKQGAVADLPKLEACRGKLAASAEDLHRCLALVFDLDRRLTQVGVYASMRYDVDTRVGRSQQMNLESQEARTRFASSIAWLRPELLAAGPEKIRALVASDPRLAPYRQPLEDILRRAPHTLDASAEKIVAETAIMADSGQAIRDVFTNAEFPYPEVTLSTGEKVRLDAAAYTKYRAAADREDRRKVFRAFWTSYAGFTRTFGTSLNAQVQAHVFNARTRKFDSSLESALFADNVPTAVYRQLLTDLHRNLPTLHRYLKLRQKMMGIDRLGYEDLYAPIVPSYDRTFTPDEAEALTLEAVAPLGADYVAALKKGFDTGWVDWFPRTGKRSGAYSTTVYGLQPFQLQNFTGLYEEVSTLAHESGHSMHSYFADKTQPYPTHDYPIFIAEVASTLNENLLVHTMLAKAKSDDERLFLLGSQLDGLRTTLFRQGLFAEFELRAHETAEKGTPLTGESLSAMYLGIVREFYGHDRGICDVDELYAAEWAYIPHFYYNFYVYQYATSAIASVSLADGIRDERSGTTPSTAKRDAYIGMLSAGSSKYAYDMLKGAGVDLATSKPFDAAMREMNRVMDEIEGILARKGTGKR